jgi:hypothetical protein
MFSSHLITSPFADFPGSDMFQNYIMILDMVFDMTCSFILYVPVTENLWCMKQNGTQNFLLVQGPFQSSCGLG